MLTHWRDGVRWEVRPDFEALLDAVLLSPATTIRESPVRTVTLHRLNGRSYYLKRYFTGRSWWRRLRFLLQKPPAARQWEAALRLERMGLPVVRALACSACYSPRGLEESSLLTEGFEGLPLTEVPEPDWSAVLGLLRQMHDRGVLQPDLHVGNILACPRSGEIRLVDLGHVRFKRTISEAERLENLAFLSLSVPIPLPPGLEELRRGLRRRFFRKRSRRCFKSNREFGPVRAGGLLWQVRFPSLGDNLRQVLEEPDAEEENGSRVLKAGRTTTVSCRDGLVVKRFNLVKAANILKDRFRGSRAERSYRLAYHLELLGIPTPRPAAFGDRKRAGFPLSCFCITEEIGGARTLARLLEVDQPLDPCLVRKISGLVAALHNEGFSHRDLKASNFLVGPGGIVYLLDLDGLKFVGQITERLAARNLVRLWRAVADAPRVGRDENLAFLLGYYRARGLRRVPRSHREIFSKGDERI